MELEVNDFMKALLLLGIGVFVFITVMSILPTSYLKDYTYSNTSNGTALNINASANQTHTIYLGTLASLTSYSAANQVNVTMRSNNASDQTIAVYVNGVYYNNISAINASTSTALVNNPGLFISGVNNITFVTSKNLYNSVNVTSTNWLYPSSTYNYNGAGSGFDAVIAGSPQVVSILVVLLVIGAVMVLYHMSQGSGFKGDRRK
jgi:hypothetical protein